jgi:hypothetical protein
MRLSDVVTQLTSKLPMLTDAFSTEVGVTSVTNDAGSVTVACKDAHGLTSTDVGKPITLTGCQTPITISSLSRATGTTVGTLVTATNHDIRYSNPRQLATPTVVISGAVEANFNGTFNVLSVPNPTTITFTIPDTGALTATGSPLLLNGFNYHVDYNGTYRITEIPDKSTLKFNHTSTTAADPVGTILARVAPRIAGAADLERVLDAYTKHATGKLYLFATVGDVSASINQRVRTDATDNQQPGNEYRQQLEQAVSLYMIIPTSEFDISARSARDTARDMFPNITKSILFHKFDSGLYVGAQNPVMFISHGMALYDTAMYVHEYQFASVFDLYMEDTVGPDLSIAVDRFDLTMYPVAGVPIEQGSTDPLDPDIYSKTTDLTDPVLPVDPMTTGGTAGDE